jgi:hypothetical protein
MGKWKGVAAAVALMAAVASANAVVPSTYDFCVREADDTVSKSLMLETRWSSITGSITQAR